MKDEGGRMKRTENGRPAILFTPHFFGDLKP